MTTVEPGGRLATLPRGNQEDMLMGTLRGWGREVLEISGLSQYGGVGAEAESPKH